LISVQNNITYEPRNLNFNPSNTNVQLALEENVIRRQEQLIEEIFRNIENAGNSRNQKNILSSLISFDLDLVQRENINFSIEDLNLEDKKSVSNARILLSFYVCMCIPKIFIQPEIESFYYVPSSKCLKKFNEPEQKGVNSNENLNTINGKVHDTESEEFHHNNNEENIHNLNTSSNLKQIDPEKDKYTSAEQRFSYTETKKNYSKHFHLLTIENRLSSQLSIEITSKILLDLEKDKESMRKKRMLQYQSFDIQRQNLPKDDILKELNQMQTKTPNEQVGVVEREDKNACVLCYDRKMDSIIQPCGHGGLCYRCSLTMWKDIVDCHICRKVF